MKKIILISGGSDGLGSAIAREFSRKHSVIILARNPHKTKQAAQKLGCDFVLADVSDHAQIEKAVSAIIKKHKRIDCLINSAGLYTEGLLEKNDPRKIKEIIDINATGTILLTRAVLPYMKKAKKGKIVNINSQSGLHVKAERSVYVASKWAITGFTQSLQMELAGSGVTVSGFYPGPMQTRIFAKAGVKKDVSKALKLRDVVRAIVFIVESPDDVAISELGIVNK